MKTLKRMTEKNLKSTTLNSNKIIQLKRKVCMHTLMMIKMFNSILTIIMLTQFKIYNLN